jgi:hypothetical protein
MKYSNSPRTQNLQHCATVDVFCPCDIFSKEKIHVHSVTVNLKRDMCSNISTIHHCPLLDMIFKPCERVGQICRSRKRSLIFELRRQNEKSDVQERPKILPRLRLQ